MWSSLGSGGSKSSKPPAPYPLKAGHELTVENLSLTGSKRQLDYHEAPAKRLGCNTAHVRRLARPGLIGRPGLRRAQPSRLRSPDRPAPTPWVFGALNCVRLYFISALIARRRRSRGCRCWSSKLSSGPSFSMARRQPQNSLSPSFSRCHAGPLECACLLRARPTAGVSSFQPQQNPKDRRRR